MPDAAAVSDFYREVIGWQAAPHDMGNYHDFDIRPNDGKGEPVAGICHTRDSNADMPPQWLIYVWVDDVAASAQRCREQGGSVVTGPRKMGQYDLCVIQDPAGAMLALIG